VRFETESGSVYEVDTERRRIRRVVRSPGSDSERAGAGEWVGYADMFPPTPELGACMLVVWAFDVGVDMLARTTLTSAVVKVGGV